MSSSGVIYGSAKNGLGRPVVIDVCNVGRGAVHKRAFMCCLSVVQVMREFVVRGHNVRGFLPQTYLNSNTDIKFQQLLEDLSDLDLVTFTPTRRIPMQDETTGRNEFTVQSYDDLYLLECARRLGGVVVSNDRFADVKHVYSQLNDVIRNRRLKISWCIDPRTGEWGKELLAGHPGDDVANILTCTHNDPDYETVLKNQFTAGQRERLITKLDLIIDKAIKEESQKLVDVDRLHVPRAPGYRNRKGGALKSALSAGGDCVTSVCNPFGHLSMGYNGGLPVALLNDVLDVCNSHDNPFDDLHNLASGNDFDDFALTSNCNTASASSVSSDNQSSQHHMSKCDSLQSMCQSIQSRPLSRVCTSSPMLSTGPPSPWDLPAVPVRAIPKPRSPSPVEPTLFTPILPNAHNHMPHYQNTSDSMSPKMTPVRRRIHIDLEHVKYNETRVSLNKQLSELFPLHSRVVMKVLESNKQVENVEALVELVIQQIIPDNNP